MPVTVQTAAHKAEVVGPSALAKKGVRADEQALPQGCQADFKEMMQCGVNFEAPDATERYISAENGLFVAAKMAYCHHHHLILRPDDLWFAILTQFSSFVNKHAEELRDRFVSHRDKKTLFLEYGGGRYHFDYTIFVKDMNELLQENILDPDLRDWILPNFSTSTQNDVLVASVIMMATLQKYFDFEIHFSCGIPSVTLLGERSDWELLLSKLEKLKSFGQEPTAFHDQLVPVISRIAKTFDDPSQPDTVSFWQRMLQRVPAMSGVELYSGWISAFCFWDFDGELIRQRAPPSDGLIYDGMIYHDIDANQVPVGWCKAPVLCNDNGSLHDFIIAAGHTTVQCSSRDPASLDNLDTLAPMATWFLYEKSDEQSDLMKKIADVQHAMNQAEMRARNAQKVAPARNVRTGGTLRRIFCCGS